MSHWSLLSAHLPLHDVNLKNEFGIRKKKFFDYILFPEKTEERTWETNRTIQKHCIFDVWYFFEFMRLPTDLITQQKIISRNNTDDIKQDISEILEKNVFINTKLESKIEVILINIYNDLWFSF